MEPNHSGGGRMDSGSAIIQGAHQCVDRHEHGKGLRHAPMERDTYPAAHIAHDRAHASQGHYDVRRGRGVARPEQVATTKEDREALMLPAAVQVLPYRLAVPDGLGQGMTQGLTECRTTAF